jgi:hypothetical protein
MGISQNELKKLTESLNEKLLKAGWIKAGIIQPGNYKALWSQKGDEQFRKIYDARLALKDFDLAPLSAEELKLLGIVSQMGIEGGNEL